MSELTIDIPEPCHADWAEMSGDARERFCGACSKHVTDLSAMTEPEARAVVAEPDVCVRYVPNADGSVRFVDCDTPTPELPRAPRAQRPTQRSPSRRRRAPLRLRGPRQLARVAATAGLALALPAAGCSTAQAGAAAADDEPGLITQAASALYDWLFAEDGCDLNMDFDVPINNPVVMGEPAPLIEEPPPPVEEPPPPVRMGKPMIKPSPLPEPEPQPEPAQLEEIVSEVGIMGLIVTPDASDTPEIEALFEEAEEAQDDAR